MKAIKLTKDILEKINPKEIVYAEFAEGGAMGACGTARIYTIEKGELKFYLVDSIDEHTENESIWSKTYEYLRSLQLNKTLMYVYAGFGNHAYKAPGAEFSRDDDNSTFIYKHGDKAYKIAASVPGVYDQIAATMAERDVPIETLEHYRNANPDKFSSAEWHFLGEYLKQLKRADAGESWFDFTAVEYMNAVAFIQHATGVNYILNVNERADTETALQKYRLKYVVDKIGWNKLNNIVNQLAIKNVTKLFESISKAISEDITKVYATLETIKSDHTSLEVTNPDNLEKLFSQPVLVEFSKSAHVAIIKDIVGRPGSSFNPDAKSVAYYLANYILNEDKLSYAEVLPAVVHIIETMPTDDFNHTHTDELFWLCGEIIDRAWRYLEEDDETQKKYRDLIYSIYWPRVGSLWPVLHYNEFEFKHKTTEKIFFDSLSFVTCLDDIADRNAEIKRFLDTNAEHIGYNAGALGRRCFVYTLRGLKPKQEFEKILEVIEPKDYCSFLTYPNGKEEVKLLMDELFRTDEDARITGESRLAVFEAIVITPNAMGIGEYMLGYIDERFDEYAEIIMSEAKILGAEPLEVLTEMFVAMSKGITEENEFAPLKSIRAKMLKMGCNRAMLDAAEKYARHHRRTILFQRSALKKLF